MNDVAPQTFVEKLIADLDTEIASLTQQKLQAEAVAQQASGAIQMAQEFKRRLQTEAGSLTVQQFTELVGGKGAKAQITPVSTGETRSANEA